MRSLAVLFFRPTFFTVYRRWVFHQPHGLIPRMRADYTHVFVHRAAPPMLPVSSTASLVSRRSCWIKSNRLQLNVDKTDPLLRLTCSFTEWASVWIDIVRQGCSLGLKRLGLETISRCFLQRLGLVSRQSSYNVSFTSLWSLVYSRAVQGPSYYNFAQEYWDICRNNRLLGGASKQGSFRSAAIKRPH